MRLMRSKPFELFTDLNLEAPTTTQTPDPETAATHFAALDAHGQPGLHAQSQV